MKRIKQLIVFLITLYLLNRVGVLLAEFINKYILIDLHRFKLDIHEWKWNKTICNIDMKGWFIRLIPFNVMYLGTYIFMIPLNASCLLLYGRYRRQCVSRFDALKQYYFGIFATYIGVYVIFFILRFFYFDPEYAFGNAGGEFLPLLCESYSPYSPVIVPGFLLANIIFGAILVYFLEPRFDRWIDGRAK